MRQTWTPADRRDLAESYCGKGASALATRLRRSVDSVCSQARRYGLRSMSRTVRQAQSRVLANPTVNSRFFDRLTPQVAFVLGFIWACGSVKTRHRNVLRLVCHENRAEQLQHVLALMQSRHQVQRYGTRLVVEICNSRLVQTLLANFGRPPGQRSEGTLPLLDHSQVRHFARGHLMGSGFQSLQCLHWSGHPTVISGLVEAIQTDLKIPATRVSSWGQSMSAAWTDASHVREIQNWLEISKRV